MLLLLLVVAAGGCASGRAPAAGAERQFERGVALTEAGRLAEAEAVFRDLVGQGAHEEEARNNLGVVLAARGRFEDALQTLRGSRFDPAVRNLDSIFRHLNARASDAGAVAPLGLELVGELGSGGRRPASQPVVPAPIPRPTHADIDQAPQPVAPPVAQPREVATGTAAGAEGREPASAAPRPPVAPAAQASAPAAAPGVDTIVIDEEERRREVEECVRGWADAWDRQQIEAYLSFYSPGFLPSDGDRGRWERERRERIGRPGSIDIDISELTVQFESGAAIATFRQAYASDSFRDVVTKTLRLVREENTWRIEQESGR